MSIEESVQAVLQGVLKANNGNKSQAALSLGVSRAVYWNWVNGKGMEKIHTLFRALERAGAVLSVQNSLIGGVASDARLVKNDDEVCRSAIERLNEETNRLRAELNRARGRIEGLKATLEVLGRNMVTPAAGATNRDDGHGCAYDFFQKDTKNSPY